MENTESGLIHSEVGILPPKHHITKERDTCSWSGYSDKKEALKGLNSSSGWRKSIKKQMRYSVINSTSLTFQKHCIANACQCHLSSSQSSFTEALIGCKSSFIWSKLVKEWMRYRFSKLTSWFPKMTFFKSCPLASKFSEHLADICGTPKINWWSCALSGCWDINFRSLSCKTYVKMCDHHITCKTQ